MNTPDPVIYEFVCQSWEKYRRDEDLPVKSIPALVPEYVEIGFARRLLQALQATFATHRPVAQVSRHRKLQRSEVR